MIIRLTDFIARLTSRATVLIFIAAVAVFEFGFSSALPTVIEKTGGTILDMTVGYSSDFAYERLESLKTAGKAYLKIRIMDTFFPTVYAFAFSLLSSFIYRKKYSEINNYRWIIVVPFAAAVFDYIENIIVIVLLHMLPAHIYFMAKVLNIVSILKFGFIGFSIFLIIAGLLSLLKGSDSMLLFGNKFKGEKKK